jgi:hypothetical protein
MTEEGLWPWSDIPEWALRALADSDPSKAYDVVTRLYQAKGLGALTQHKDWETSGRVSLEAVSRWLRSGSQFVRVHESDVLDTIMRLGPEPRWHALTREGPGFMVDIHPKYASDKFAPEGTNPLNLLTLIFVQPTVNGPRIHPWNVVLEQDAWGSCIPLSGIWDLLSWQSVLSDPRIQGIPLVGVSSLACNIVAAILDADEEIALRLRGKKEREAMQGMKKVRPVVYRLDPTGMKTWVKKVVQQDKEAARGPSNTTRTVRLHMCKGHKRKTWVKAPGPDEAVIGRRQGKTRKDGTCATLYCVKRPVIGHARGTGVAEKPVILRST